LKYTNFWKASTLPFFFRRLLVDGSKALWYRFLSATGGDRAVLGAVVRREGRRRRRWLLEP